MSHECASIGAHVHPVQTLFILIICSFMLLTCSNSTKNIAARDCSHLVKDQNEKNETSRLDDMSQGSTHDVFHQNVQTRGCLVPDTIKGGPKGWKGGPKGWSRVHDIQYERVILQIHREMHIDVSAALNQAASGNDELPTGV